MRTILFLFSCSILSFVCIGQTYTGFKKGQFYLYWGWNWEKYSKSDIYFSGTDYNFTLKRVKAKDKPTKFGIDPYFAPTKLTITQFNARIGYFFTDHWNLSFGIDHMKYVMRNDQSVKISGNMSNTQTPYDGTYNDEDIYLSRDFLLFEHTDMV